MAIFDGYSYAQNLALYLLATDFECLDVFTAAYKNAVKQGFTTESTATAVETTFNAVCASAVRYLDRDLCFSEIHAIRKQCNAFIERQFSAISRIGRDLDRAKEKNYV